MKSEEHAIQCAFVKWARLNERAHPELALLFAVPNGGQRNVIVASKLKAEGVRAGVPDMCIPVARRGHIGLWIEFKSAKGRVSDSQMAYRELLEHEGHRVEVCRAWDDAAEVVKWYLGKV